MIDYKPSCYNYTYRISEKELLLVNSLYDTKIKIASKTCKCFDDIIRAVQKNNDKNFLDCLVKKHFLVEKDIDEKELNKFLYNKSIFSDDSLSVQVVLGNRCNFNCTYCWQEHCSSEDLADDDIIFLESFLKMKMRKKHALSIDWIGGEPLLYYQTIIKLTEYINKITSKGKIFSSGITTNGYLLDTDMFKLLVDNRVNQYMITIDGIEKTHNVTRCLASGKPTYDVIKSNLQKILKVKPSYTSIIIRINFLPQMLGKEHEIIAEYKDSFDISKLNILVVPAIDPSSDIPFSTTQDYVQFCIKLKEGGLPLIPLNNLTFMQGVCTNAYYNSYTFMSSCRIKKCSQEKWEISVKNKTLTLSDELYLCEWNRQRLLPDCDTCAFMSACQSMICPLRKERCHLKVAFDDNYGKLLQYEETFVLDY